MRKTTSRPIEKSKSNDEDNNNPYRWILHEISLDESLLQHAKGWVVLSDKVGAIEMGRTLAAQIRWEARVIDLQNGSDQRLLVCQKPFVKK
nr:isoform 2 of probable methyltransferase pmt5 [Quercus suber]